MKTIGRHLIAEFYDCDPSRLDDRDHVRSTMLDAAKDIGATVVADSFHRFAPQGISGSVIIAESHLSIHTWPEYGYAAVDIFTCGGLDPRAGLRLLEHSLGAASSRLQEIVRGLPEEIEREAPWTCDDIHIVSRITELHSTPAPVPPALEARSNGEAVR